jgi:hypothetical protein
LSIGTFRVVDDANLAAVILDLNDTAGTSFTLPPAVTSQVRLLQLRTAEIEAVRFSPERAPGASTPWSKDPLVTTSWRQRISGGTIDQRIEALGQINTYLRRGCTIECKLTGETESRYLDVEPSSAIPMVGDDPADVFHATLLADYPEGIPVAVLRQPYRRMAELSAAANVLLNPFLLWDTQAPTNTPDDWVWSTTANITNQTIDSTTDAYRFDIATTATRALRQVYAAAVAGDIWAGSFYAWVLAGSGAKARVTIDYLDIADAVLATHTGTLVTLTPRPERQTLVTPAAPASTAKVRIGLTMGNADATAYTVYFTRSQLEKSSVVTRFRGGEQTVENDPAGAHGRALPVWNDGDAPCPVKVKIKAGTGAKLAAVLVAARSNNGPRGRLRLADFLNTVKLAQCEGGTLSNDTAGVVDADASPGSGTSAAETAYTTDPTVMKKRVRFSGSALMAARRGSWEVRVRLKAMGAARHVVQLRWSPNLNADPAPFTGPEVVHDTTGFSTFAYIEKTLGTIRFPTDFNIPLSGLALELWSRRESGSTALRWDCISFVPVEDSSLAVPLATMLVVPGTAKEEWFGDDFVGGGAASFNPAGLSNGGIRNDGLYDLNAQNEAAGTPPVAGLAWPIGRHRITFYTRVRDNGSVDVTYEVRVRNITDSNYPAGGQLALTRGAAHPNSGFDYVDTIEFDSAAGKSYQPQVAYTSVTTRNVGISKIAHEFVPYLAANEQMRSDPVRGVVEKIESDDELLDILAVEGGVPFWLQPGLSVIYFSLYDVPTGLYTDRENVRSRTAVASALPELRFNG